MIELRIESPKGCTMMVLRWNDGAVEVVEAADDLRTSIDRWIERGVFGTWVDRTVSPPEIDRFHVYAHEPGFLPKLSEYITRQFHVIATMTEEP